MSHLRPSASPDLPLYVVTGVSELLLGLTLFSVPGQFNAAIYQQILPWFSPLSAGMVAGGVLLFLQARYDLGRWLAWLFTLAAAIPTGVVAVHFAADGYGSAAVIYGLTAAAVLAAPALPHTGPGAPFRWGLFGRCIGVAQLAVGAMMLAWPAMFQMLTAAISPAMLAAIGILGLSGGGLLLGYGTSRSWETGAGKAARLVGALFCVVMTVLTVQSRHWAGTAFWVTWAAGLLFATEARMRCVVRRQAQSGAATRETTLRWMESLMEAWAWALALLVMALPLLLSPQVLVSQSAAEIFVLGICTYNIGAHWVFPAVGSARQRLISHLTALSLALFWLLANAGMAAFSLAICAVLIPVIATGAVGDRAGVAFMGLHGALAIAGALYRVATRDTPPLQTLGSTLMYVLMLALTEGLGVYAMLYVRRLMTDLAAARQSAREAESRRRILEAQESVRRQVSERLHGTVQSRLVVLGHRLNQARQLLADPPAAEEILRDVAGQLDRLRDEEVRTLSHRLHPALVRFGPTAVLGYLRDQFEGAFEVDLLVSPDVEALPAPGDKESELVCLVLHRVAEEFLCNTLKHAQSAAVRITAEISDGQDLVLSLEDRGCGFDVAEARAGLGLTMMQDYVQAVGGSYNLSSLAGQGTVLQLRIPLPAGCRRKPAAG